MEQAKIIGVSSSSPADREWTSKLIAQLTQWELLDFDAPIIRLMNDLTGQQTAKNSESMNSYLGTEWSYVIQEKFMENNQLVFKPVRYYLTPKQIFTRLKYEMRVIHADIWVNAFFNNNRWANSVLPVQYPNQADAIISREGIIIRFNNPNNTSPISKEDSLLDGYPFTHVIEMKQGWGNELNKILGFN